MAERLFLKILNMSISASYLVLAVLLLRFLLKKGPKWVSVLLWGIVALRLLCPFTPESALSLIPSRETVSPEILLSPTPAIESGIPAVNTVVNPVITEAFVPDPSASANPLQVWTFIASVVWLGGMALMALYSAVSYRRLHRRVGTATRLTGNIYQSEAVSSPFILGLVRPRIYLPYRLESPDISYIIAHEQAHIRRRDHWWKPLGFALLTVHWFNPLLWAAYILLCRDIELACDERVIRDLGGEQRADYSQSLLNASVHRKSILACPLAFGEVGVKERIVNVLNYKKPAFWVIVLSVAACCTTAVCFLTDPHDAPQNVTGKTYRVSEVVYDDPGYSSEWWYEEGDIYCAISGRGYLLTKDLFTEEEFWANRGLLREYDLTYDSFEHYIKDGFSEFSAFLLRLGNQKTWRLVSHQETDSGDYRSILYYLLRQKNGDLYLAWGFHDENGEVGTPSDDSSIRRILKLEDAQQEAWGVAMNAESVSSTGLTLVLQSIPIVDGEITCDADYFLEKRSGEEWVSVEPLPGEHAVNTIAYLIQPDSIRHIDVNWAGRYGALPPGDYRIGKTLHLQTAPGESKTSAHYAEFSLKETAEAPGAGWAPTLVVEEATTIGATIVFRQSAEAVDGVPVTSNKYFLQAYENGQWTDVPILAGNPTWSGEAFAISAAPREKLNWQWLYGILPEGRYRIGKTVTLQRDTVNQESTTVYAEFTAHPATPYPATSSLKPEDIRSIDVTLSALAREEEEMTFLHQEVDTIVRLLNGLEEDSFYKGPAISPNVAMTIHGHDDADSLYLESDGKLVEISYDLSTPEGWEESSWTVKNDALNRYIAGLWDMPKRLSALACPAYRVSGILYTDPDYAGIYTPGVNVPTYGITDNGHLLVKDEYDSLVEWADMGKFDLFEVTSQNFDPHFRASFDAAAIREENLYSWILFSRHQSVGDDLQYWLLQQKNGDLLLAHVHPSLGFSEVIWLMKLETGQVTPANTATQLPERYDTLEQAIQSGCAIMSGNYLQYNTDAWEDIMTVFQSGRPFSVRYVEMTADFAFYVRELTFDGSRYILRRTEDTEEEAQTFQYLNHVEDDMPFDVFILTNHPTSSENTEPKNVYFCSQHTYPHLPGDLKSAALQWKGSALTTLSDKALLTELHTLLSSAEALSGSPDVSYLGPELLLRTAGGEEIRISLDLYGKVILYNSLYFRCDVSQILALLGYRGWPEAIINAYPEVPLS